MATYPTTCRPNGRTEQRSRLASRSQDRHTLQLHEVWRPAVSQPLVVTCLEGRCWITRAGDPSDYLLQPGMQFTIQPRESVVLEALAAETMVMLAAPDR